MLEKALLTAPPLPPMPSQCVTSVPTTPVEPVYSVLPSGLGEVPFTLLPLDDVPVPTAWSIPPPETRPPPQSAWVEISAKVATGPSVAPGVFTVTPTELAYAVPGADTTRRTPITSVLPAPRRRRDLFFIGFSLTDSRTGRGRALRRSGP